MQATVIIDAVRFVTNKWKKQREAEDRDARKRERRQEALSQKPKRVTVKDAAYECIPAAYMKMSDNNTNPAKARQIMYAARGPIQAKTGEPLNDKYFIKTLLMDYLRDHPDETKDWDIVFDARGHFTEPHTGDVVPLGTIEVRDYLGSVPKHLLAGLMFIEKEGFNPLFEHHTLAERWDLAIMSTKGTSVTAARTLAESLCNELDIPFFLLHDFDKTGFSIAATLQRDTARYAFTKPMKVIDMGLTLEDAKKWNLIELAEDVDYGKSNPEENLRLNGATEEEIAFLIDKDKSRSARYGPSAHYVGRRIELNAFTGNNLIAFIESKLEQYGLKKVVPGQQILKDAYRADLEKRIFEKMSIEIKKQAKREAARLKIPKELADKVRESFGREAEQSWKTAIWKLASSHKLSTKE